jgi:uncharacterized membrane protein
VTVDPKTSLWADYARFAIGLRSLLGLLAGAMFLASSLPAGSAPSRGWTIVDLGTLPGGVESGALGINDVGDVVGYSSSEPYRVQSVGLWPNSIGFENGGMGPETTGVLFSGGSVTAVSVGAAYAVSGSGEAVGGVFRPGGDAEFTAYGVNGGGQVVGGTGSKYSVGDAVEFANGAETVLGHLADDHQSTAYGINDSGEAVGESGQSAVAGGLSHHHAVLFNGGQVIPLGALKGDTDSWAFGINDSGVAVGVSQGLDSSQAVLFRRGHVTDLGAPAGDLHSQALAINADGVAVGTSDSDGFTFHAALFTGKDAIRLDTLLPPGSGWTLQRATAINDSGQIAGEGTHDGQQRAFLLTPPGNASLTPASGIPPVSSSTAPPAPPAGPIVFLHYDYMAVPGPDGHTDAPDSAQVQAMVDAFAAHGITLAIDNRHAIIPESQAVVFDEDASDLPPMDCLGPDWVDFSTLKAAYFHPTGNHPWHYAVFGRYGDAPWAGNSCGLYSLSGHSQLPGYDLQVTTGRERDIWDAASGRAPAFEDGGTFMHELGHNLGLRHGGDEDVNYKPNYLSVMNYDFQFSGIPYGASPGSTKPVGFRLDYSDVALPTLDENHLDENLGLQDTTHPTYITLDQGCDDSADEPAFGPIDWNFDGNATESDVAADITVGDSSISCGFLSRLTGFDDWAEIRQFLTDEAAHPVAPGTAVQ